MKPKPEFKYPRHNEDYGNSNLKDFGADGLHRLQDQNADKFNQNENPYNPDRERVIMSLPKDFDSP